MDLIFEVVSFFLYLNLKEFEIIIILKGLLHRCAFIPMNMIIGNVCFVIIIIIIIWVTWNRSKFEAEKILFGFFVS